MIHNRAAYINHKCRCELCVADNRAYLREWHRRTRERNPDYDVNKRRQGRRGKLKQYGLTSADYDRLLAAQDGICAVCFQPPTTGSLAVDHEHVSNRVRGLLCIPCNLAIGNMNDNPTRLRNAAAYLENNANTL